VPLLEVLARKVRSLRAGVEALGFTGVAAVAACTSRKPNPNPAAPERRGVENFILDADAGINVGVLRRGVFTIVVFGRQTVDGYSEREGEGKLCILCSTTTSNHECLSYLYPFQV